MTDCVLPVTGGDPLPLVLLALLALAAGVALVLGVRRRGVGSGATMVIVFALAAAALVVGSGGKADAQECAPATTVTPTAAPTTIAATTTAAATTTTVATTTTASTTTATIGNGGAIPIAPSTPAVPDLTPTIDGPQTLLLFGPSGTYTVTVKNVGTASTDGQPMTFTVSFPFTVVGFAGALMDPFGVTSTDWTVSEDLGTAGSAGSPGTPTVLTFTSNSGVVIPAGGTSTVAFSLEFLGEDAAEFSVDVMLPTGIGGESNGANNTASQTVTILPPLPD